MTDIQILEKAFEKVKKNGLELNSIVPKLVLKYSNIETVIFDHKFAKAFWGEQFICNKLGHKLHGSYNDPKEHGYIEAWKYHLIKMVLEKEPLKYMEKFL